MTKINFVEKNVEDLTVKELKDLIKESETKVPGYHDMKKSELVQNVIDIYADFIEDETEDVKEEIIEEVIEEIVEEVEEIVEEKLEEKNKVKKPKYTYLIKNPEGEIVKEYNKLKDVYDYAETNGICTRGWVSLSIERDIPVLIGLGRDKEVTEDFVPRVTKKYNGNYWKFEKIENEEI